MSSKIRGLVKRRLYKPERAPARVRGSASLIGSTELRISKDEARLAIFALCCEAGLIVGRGLSYDKRADEFVVLAKDRESGKVVEARLAGERIAGLVAAARILNGGRLERKTRPRLSA